MDAKKIESLTIFLNRGCPRHCPQCGVVQTFDSGEVKLPFNTKRAQTIPEWKETFQILHDTFGTKFFLMLGTEPLLYREGLVDLVDWFTKHNLFYGFYSTSPEPMFTQYRQPLIDAGLNNWSSGIDGIPGMFGDAQDPMDPITRNKVEESIEGLKWMAERGVQTHTLTTIHKKNFKDVPKIMAHLQEYIGHGVQSSCNFVEWWRPGTFDFFSPPEQMKDLLWDGTEAEIAEVKAVMAEIKALSRRPGFIIQTVDSYLDEATLHYRTMDKKCVGQTGPGIDCDGSLRVCGYSKGEKSQKWWVKDLKDPAKLEEFMKVWMEDIDACSGCHWQYCYMTTPENFRILDPESGIHQERWDYGKKV